jgi:hypothetical protein
VAEDGVLSAGEHGRHPVALTADLRMADGVDAAVERVQPAGTHAAVDRMAAAVEFSQLAPRDDAVLVGGKHRDRRIQAKRVDFAANSAANSSRVGHRASMRARR